MAIGITLADVHLNWLNWFHFLILEGSLLVILVYRLHDFSVTITRCHKDVYVNGFFPCRARPLNSLTIEYFPLTYDLNHFKSRINRHLRFFLNIFSVCLNLFVILFLVTPCLVVAVRPCMEWISILKKALTAFTVLWNCLKDYLCYKTILSHKIALDVQLMNFFIWRKNNISFLRYRDFCVFVKSTDFKIREIIISIARQRKLHLCLFLLNSKWNLVKYLCAIWQTSITYFLLNAKDWKLVLGSFMILLKWQYSEIRPFLMVGIYHF